MKRAYAEQGHECECGCDSFITVAGNWEDIGGYECEACGSFIDEGSFVHKQTDDRPEYYIPTGAESPVN